MLLELNKEQTRRLRNAVYFRKRALENVAGLGLITDNELEQLNALLTVLVEENE